MRQNQLCFKGKYLLVQNIRGQTKSIFTGRLTKLFIIVVNIAKIKRMDYISCTQAREWSTMIDLPLKHSLWQQKASFCYEAFPNHCLRATYTHKEGAGRTLLLRVLKHFRDSFVSNYALAQKSYRCLKSFFETREK